MTRVRRDAGLLPREERAGATDAALHLVEDEQRAVLVGERAGGGEKLGAGRMDPALALDRLDQDRGGVGPGRRRQRVDVVQLREPGHGREGLPRLRASPAAR